ncbi:MAG: hypothetical protein LC670_14305 [Flavobacteriales bacterium]|nr:hypothetical protein [Flavobacteriales bacterium]
MPKRTSPKQIKAMDDLDNLDKIVVDKRRGKRAEAKKERWNRHYTKLLINEQVRKNADIDPDEDSDF